MKLVIDRTRFSAFAFDLDGVVTRTATVHAAAWKRTFDELLEPLGGEPFDVAREYRTYVDGKPRRDGIRSFLAARGITLPDGKSRDAPTARTIAGLAARKNTYFLEVLSERGVEVYVDAARLCSRIKSWGGTSAIVSASESCRAVLAAANLSDVFEVVVDGHDVSRLGLQGKPSPDTFVEAARRLGVEPGRCVVLEDAIAGIRAGRAGKFGLVVGVDRAGDPDVLRRSGADVVVTALDELELIPLELR